MTACCKKRSVYYFFCTRFSTYTQKCLLTISSGTLLFGEANDWADYENKDTSTLLACEHQIDVLRFDAEYSSGPNLSV